MNGLSHVIVSLIFCIGIMSNVLIDFDHRLSYKEYVKGFFGESKDYELNKSRPLHTPLIMYSLIVFFIGLGLGLLLHLFMDSVAVQ